MKQQTALSGLAIGLFAAMMFAQSARPRQNVPADPGGWTKAKWGMKESQIKAAFPQTAQVKDSAGKVRLGLSEYPIDLDKYTVTFWFAEDGGLASIAFDPETKGPRNAVAEAVKLDLLDDLTEKYGTPTAATNEKNEHGGGSTRKWQWRFSKTRIILTWAAYADPDFKHLDQTYLIYSQIRPRGDL